MGSNRPQAQIGQALDQLLSWDFVLSKDSVPAAIYVAWERALATAVWTLVVPKEARAIFPQRSLSTEKLIRWLTNPDGRFGADPVAGRDALLLRSLTQAVSELERRLGPDRNRWRYGQEAFKHIRLKHPLSDAVTAELRTRLDLGPLPRGGYGHTVNSTSDDDNQSTGASFRIIADTGDWDRSVGTNTPGQSGDPASPHYRDLFEPWADGQYFPVYFTRAKDRNGHGDENDTDPMKSSRSGCTTPKLGTITRSTHREDLPTLLQDLPSQKTCRLEDGCDRLG